MINRFCVGVNGATRLLEKREALLVIIATYPDNICYKVRFFSPKRNLIFLTDAPPMLTSHIPIMCQTQGVPLFPFRHSSRLGSLFGHPRTAIAAALKVHAYVYLFSIIYPLLPKTDYCESYQKPDEGHAYSTDVDKLLDQIRTMCSFELPSIYTSWRNPRQLTNRKIYPKDDTSTTEEEKGQKWRLLPTQVKLVGPKRNLQTKK